MTPSEKRPSSEHELPRSSSVDTTATAATDSPFVPSHQTHERTQNTKRTWLALAIIGLTVPAAYYHGVLLHRWGDPSELKAYVDALQALPTTLGPWQYTSDGEPIAPQIERQLGIRGYAHRIYENEVTKQKVTMLLLVGPAGPLLRHPPEVCYATRANQLLSARSVSVPVNGSMANLRLLSYESTSSVDGDFLVAYAFGRDGLWNKPSTPRLVYGGEPVLYKLHVLTDVSDEVSVETPAGLMGFLERLLPALNKVTPGTASELPAQPTAPRVAAS